MKAFIIFAICLITCPVIPELVGRYTTNASYAANPIADKDGEYYLYFMPLQNDNTQWIRICNTELKNRGNFLSSVPSLEDGIESLHQKFTIIDIVPINGIHTRGNFDNTATNALFVKVKPK